MADPLTPLGRAPLPVLRPRLRGNASADVLFDVPDSPEASTSVPKVPTAGGLDAIDPILFQELGADSDERRNQASRRHGEDVLEVLAEFQRELLRGGAETMSLERLSRLIETAPEAVDPCLAAASRSILLRARIEIARRLGRPAAQD